MDGSDYSNQGDAMNDRRMVTANRPSDLAPSTKLGTWEKEFVRDLKFSIGPHYIPPRKMAFAMNAAARLNPSAILISLEPWKAGGGKKK